MRIRRAEEKDIPRLHELLGQVLQIHADIRPDIFIPGTTKYTDETRFISRLMSRTSAKGTRSASSCSSPFPTIWYRSCRFLSTIYVLIRRPEDSMSARACSSLSSRRRRGLAAMRCS